MKLKNLKKIMSILILIILINCTVPLISRATDNSLIGTSEDSDVDLTQEDVQENNRTSKNTDSDIGLLQGAGQTSENTNADDLLLQEDEQETDRKSKDDSEVSSPTISGFSDWQQQAKDFIKEGNKDAKISTSDAINAFVPIGKILVGVGTIVLVVVGLIFGVKYMMSGADERARTKTKTYILCYFSSTNIWCSRNILYSNRNFE